MLVSLDINRPAAFDQLKVLSEKINVFILPKIEEQLPIDIVKRSFEAAKLQEVENEISSRN